MMSYSLIDGVVRNGLGLSINIREPNRSLRGMESYCFLRTVLVEMLKHKSQFIQQSKEIDDGYLGESNKQ